VERAKTNYLAAAELGSVGAMLYLGRLLDKDDSQRFVWLGRAASANVGCVSFRNWTCKCRVCHRVSFERTH
jgi:hypothetical protein